MSNTKTATPTATAALRQHSNISCGAATICAIRRKPDAPEQYALPGGTVTTCRDQARFAAVRLDALIKANGGAKALLKSRNTKNKRCAA